MIAKGLLVWLSCRRSPEALEETRRKELYDRRQRRKSALSSYFLCAQPMGFYIGAMRNNDDGLFLSLYAADGLIHQCSGERRRRLA
jgi:hypothetical protein